MVRWTWQSELPMGATTATRTRLVTSVIRRSSFPIRAWVGRQPTDHNQTRSQRLQHHDDLWLWNPTAPDDGHSNHTQAGKRYAHPQPERKPLVLANSQKFGHLGQGCANNWTYISSDSPHSNMGLQIFISIPYVCRHSSGPRHPVPAQQDKVTKSGNRQLRHVRPKSRSTTVWHTKTLPRSGH